MANSVQFARNLTTKEALESKESGTIYFMTDDNSIVMGGKEYGKDCISQDDKDFLSELQKKDNVKISVYPSKLVVNPGEEFDVIVKVYVSGVPLGADTEPVGNGILTSCPFSMSGLGVYKATCVCSTLGEISSWITVTVDGYTQKGLFTISCDDNILYGWSISSSITLDSEVKTFITSKPSKTSDGEYNFSSSRDGYFYILIPDGTKVSTSFSAKEPYGIESGIPVYFIKQPQKYNKYTVYRIADKQTASSHVIKLI